MLTLFVLDTLFLPYHIIRLFVEISFVLFPITLIIRLRANLLVKA